MDNIKVYAVLREDSSTPGNSQTVCGEAGLTGERKETLIFSSVTGSVEIRLVVSAPRHKSTASNPSTSQVPSARFLVKFEGKHDLVLVLAMASGVLHNEDASCV